MIFTIEVTDKERALLLNLLEAEKARFTPEEAFYKSTQELIDKILSEGWQT